MKMRHTTRIAVDIAIGLLALLTIAAVVAAVLVASYPRTAARIRTEITVSSPALALAAAEAGSATEAVIDRSREGYEYRIAPVVARAPGVRIESDETVTAAAEEAPAFPVDSCEQCHSDREERLLFSVVSVPHSLHAEEGVECMTCHESDGPGRCSVPMMDECGGCHAETECGSRACGICHEESSLFHGARIARSRTLGEHCDHCHELGEQIMVRQRQHEMPMFDRSSEACSRCHQNEFCSSCHPADHPAGYAVRHYGDLRQSQRAQIECYQCHDPRGCVDGCHAYGRRSR